MQGAAASVRLDPEVGAPAEFADRPCGRDLAAGVNRGRRFGEADIPQEAFIAAMNLEP